MTLDEQKEKIFYKSAETWTPTSGKKETEFLLNAATDYFDPGILLNASINPPDTDYADLVMTGIALGDMAGEPYEGLSASEVTGDKGPGLYKKLPFLKETSVPTDDTVMSAAIKTAALSIHRAFYMRTGKIFLISRLFGRKNVENSVRCIATYSQWMKTLAKKYPDAGYGGHFYEWAVLEKKDGLKSYGNGGAMRSGIIGAVFYDCPVKAVIEQALLSALPTHSDPEGIKGAVITAVSVYLGLHNIKKDLILDYMSRYYEHKPVTADKDPYRIKPGMRLKDLTDDPELFTLSVKTQITMPEVIINLRESDDYESCIRNAFRYRCDADTIGAISGGIVAAIYKDTDVKGLDVKKEIKARIPEELRATMYNRKE